MSKAPLSEAELRQRMHELFGSSYISDAFKVAFKRYYHLRYDVFKMEETEMSVIFELTKIKFGCRYVDVRPLADLRTTYGIRVQHIGDMSLELAVRQLRDLLGIEYNDNPDLYYTYLPYLGIIGNMEDFFLLCFDENVKGTVVTSSSNPFLLINFSTKTVVARA